MTCEVGGKSQGSKMRITAQTIFSTALVAVLGLTRTLTSQIKEVTKTTNSSKSPNSDSIKVHLTRSIHAITDDAPTMTLS